MFINQKGALKDSFKDLMDNKAGNDVDAHQKIAQLTQGMSDAEIFDAFNEAKDEAQETNRFKAQFSGETPYQNVNSRSAQVGLQHGMQANNPFSAVPPHIWAMMGGAGGRY